MEELKEKFASMGVGLPRILLPNKDIDIAKWAVIACDQFSSEKEYWEEVYRLTEGSPSTVNLIFPEAYLSERDLETEVDTINSAMTEYLEKGYLQELSPGFILVERTTGGLPVRRGLVLSIDLEQYEFREGTHPLIRPTEGTIIDRLPPRIKIREGAALDLPHILFLIDDPDGKVIERAAEKSAEMDLLYDVELMQNGGHITGRKIDDPAILGSIAEGLESLLEANGFLFAVGDGNHSLAAAKTIWENLKKEGGEAVKNHPARWALVEVENIYDSAIIFEPIHRVLFDVDCSKLLEYLETNPGYTYRNVSSMDEMENAVGESQGLHTIGYLDETHMGLITLTRHGMSLTAELVQDLLDSYIEKNSGIEIDYIHGEEALGNLGRTKGNAGFFLPPVKKSSFFSTIIEKGTFPRKTFSIGESEGKRYYLEARKLIP